MKLKIYKRQRDFRKKKGFSQKLKLLSKSEKVKTGTSKKQKQNKTNCN